MSLPRPEAPRECVPNLAPMIDVIMVILVFFMLGASLELIQEGALTTELDPRSGPGEGVPIQIVSAVKIALEEADGGAACRMYVMGQPLAQSTFAGLRDYLRERRDQGADPTNPVVIAAQAGVKWKFAVEAMDAAIRAGFKNVQFAVHLGGGTEVP